MIALRSLLFNVCFYLNTMLLMVIGLPTMIMGPRAVMALARLWGRTSLALLRVICGLRVEFRGLENIPPGGRIIASKHESFLEAFAILLHAPDFSYILKRQLIFIPVFGLYLVAGAQIAIDRSRGRAALNRLADVAAAAVKAGRQIIIFPEGTRRRPGAAPQYKYGVASLYAATGAVCLPVALNTGLYWGRRGFLRRPGTAVIEYLAPIPPGLTLDVFAARLEGEVEAACDRLNAEAIHADPRLAEGMESRA